MCATPGLLAGPQPRPFPDGRRSPAANLDASKKTCVQYSRAIERLGRNKVAKAIEFGRFLNELYDEYFAPQFSAAGVRLPKAQQPPYWKKWSSTLKEWGLNEKTLLSYRVLAKEAEISVELTEFSSITKAYREARCRRSERELAEAKRHLDETQAIAAMTADDRAISLGDVERGVKSLEQALDQRLRHVLAKDHLNAADDPEHARLVEELREKEELYERGRVAQGAPREVEEAAEGLRIAQRAAQRAGNSRPKFEVRFWLNDDGTLGYSYRNASGVVGDVGIFWRKASQLVDLPDAGSDAWKSALGGFVVRAVAAHAQKGLEFADAEDADGVAALMDQPTSADREAEHEAVREFLRESKRPEAAGIRASAPVSTNVTRPRSR